MNAYLLQWELNENKKDLKLLLVAESALILLLLGLFLLLALLA